MMVSSRTFMGRSANLLADKGLASVVVRLMMAMNDLGVANSALAEWDQTIDYGTRRCDDAWDSAATGRRRALFAPPSTKQMMVSSRTFMGRSANLLADKGLASVVVRLMMAMNDLGVANSALAEWDQTKDRKGMQGSPSTAAQASVKKIAFHRPLAERVAPAGLASRQGLL